MNNLRGSLLMIMAMAFFNLEDTVIKALSTRFPVGQLMLTVGIAGLMLFWGLLLRRGLPLLTSDFTRPALLIRSGGEFVGALGFVTALALTPISSATAILMAAPLATVLGAALMGEEVGWRRWLAVGAGFIGVMMVVKPGTDAFQPASLFAVMGVTGLVVRDLATPKVPVHVHSLQVSGGAYIGGILAGIVMLAFQGKPMAMPIGWDWPLMALMVGAGATGYMAIVTATRIGELSVVVPMRYARLVFAMAVGVIFFHERPDALTLIGSGIIVTSGLYSIWREARLRRRAASLARPRTV